MAWTVPFTRCISSPEPAEESSPTASPASSPSAPSSSRTIPAESSPCAGPEWPSGTTYAPSEPTTPTAPTPSAGSAPTPGSSSWPAASPARTSPPPERERASPRASARVCGASLPASFARYDPPTHSWRIPQCLFQGDLSLYSATWPRSGILLDGTCYPLPPWAPPTNANESGSPARYPTVCAHDKMAQGGGLHGWMKNGKELHRNLNDLVVRMAQGGRGQWHTPNARDWKDTGATQGNRHSPNLGTAVHTHTHTHTATRVPEVPVAAEPRLPVRTDGPARMGEEPRPSPAQPERLRAFPTPRVHDATHDGPSELARHAPNLATLVKRIP